MKSICIIALSILIGLAGCVKIETPENLVSDTYKTGKEVFRDAKDSLSKKQKPGENNTFSGQYIVQTDQSLESAFSNCIEELKESTRKSLNVYQLDIVDMSTKTTTQDGNTLVDCTITLK